MSEHDAIATALPEQVARLERRVRRVTVLAVAALVLGPLAGAATTLLVREPGPQGPQGPTGVAGPAGPVGPAGKDGASLTDPAVQQALAADVSSQVNAALPQGGYSCVPMRVVTDVGNLAWLYGSAGQAQLNVSYGTACGQ